MSNFNIHHGEVRTELSFPNTGYLIPYEKVNGSWELKGNVNDGKSWDFEKTTFTPFFHKPFNPGVISFIPYGMDFEIFNEEKNELHILQVKLSKEQIRALVAFYKDV